MRPLIRLSLLLAVALVPVGAGAETCLSTASFVWSTVGAGSWSGCTPSADDLFVIRNGNVVDVAGDIRQSATAPAAGIQVEAGGTLRALVQQDALVLAVGGAGLFCRAGSTCDLRGGYRPFAGAHAKTLPAQSDIAFLRAGEVVPCPGIDASGVVEPDCSGALTTPGAPNVVRFSYAAPTPAVTAGLARIRSDDGTGNGEDVLCFFDPDVDDGVAAADVNYCYRITGADAGAPASLDFDVRQTGWTARDSNYPIARRIPVQLAIDANVAAGARDIEVDGSLLAAGQDGRYEGYWIHLQADDEPCGDGDAVPCRVAAPGYRILDTHDGGPGQPDRIRIGDPRGVDRCVAAGETAWILIGGWTPGDPISVWAPVIVRSATSAANDSTILFDGTTRLRTVWFDDTSSVHLRGSALDVQEARDLWLAGISSASTTSANLLMESTVGERLHVEHLTITGGNRTGTGEDRLHGFVHQTGTDSHLEFSDVAVRYHGDDCLVSGVAAVDLVAERVRCQYPSDDATTTSAIDTSDVLDSVVEVHDLECVHCSEPGGDAVNVVASDDVTIDGLLVWGGHTRIGALGATLNDTVALGVEPGVTSAFVYGNPDRFVFREIQLGGAASIANEPGIELRNGIVRDFTVAGPIAFPFRGDAVLDNVALVDLTTTAVCGGSCLAIRLINAPLVELRRLTAVWTPALSLDLPGESIPNRVLHSNATSHLGVTIDGFLAAGHWPTTGTALTLTAAQSQQTSWGAGPCFHDNRSNFSSLLAPYLPPTTVQGQPPGFVDLVAGRVDTLPGSVADLAGCGINRGVASPGVRHRWIHALSKIPPERMADDADADGVPEDAFAPPCSNGMSSDCSDNCPALFNPRQGDADGDAVGDACDAPCDNGADDDGDRLVDFPDDPGCSDAADISERDATKACDNGLDDDGDGFVDADDPGCPNTTNPIENPICDDGLDNDGDGKIDFDDPQCDPAAPYREAAAGGCGLGGECALLLVALRLAQRRSASNRPR